MGRTVVWVGNRAGGPGPANRAVLEAASRAATVGATPCSASMVAAVRAPMPRPRMRTEEASEVGEVALVFITGEVYHEPGPRAHAWRRAHGAR